MKGATMARKWEAIERTVRIATQVVRFLLILRKILPW